MTLGPHRSGSCVYVQGRVSDFSFTWMRDDCSEIAAATHGHGDGHRLCFYVVRTLQTPESASERHCVCVCVCLHTRVGECG